jgi:hypothetical protein
MKIYPVPGLRSIGGQGVIEFGDSAVDAVSDAEGIEINSRPTPIHIDMSATLKKGQ